MKTFIRTIFAAVLLLGGTTLQAQILDVTPAFPTVDDEVTIIYNAAEGNGALVGIDEVFIHTGLITSESENPNDWQLVPTEWATENANTVMESLGNNLHRIVIDIDQYYNVPSNIDVEKLAFVFRNADGSTVGRAADGSDIFYNIYQNNGEIQASILSPSENIIVEIGDALTISAQSSGDANLTLSDNGTQIAASTDTTALNYTFTVSQGGFHTIVLSADNGSSSSNDTIYYTVVAANAVEEVPANTELGINYISDSKVRLKLYAPMKEYVYVIGDFNNWTARPEYQMKRASDGATYWLEIDGLTPDTRYGFQYWIDGDLKVADAYSELIADPSNDQFIDVATYPNPYPYPFGKTTGILTLIHPGKPAYNWTATEYQRPQQNELIIYELLLRDFDEKHNYQSLIDRMDYFVDLGINAIELMPPGEFEGNLSWGYNPSFHMALDKYYGTPEKFKEFIDVCHQNGIAVIVDMVLNHAFSQNPLSQMYWDATTNTVAANSPFFNAVCPSEPFCWGSDFNHDAQPVRDYVSRIVQFWLEEYNIDGYRFDFTSGFHNGGSGGYSEARMYNLRQMRNAMHEVDPGSYAILEHWADGSEEGILANEDFMLWVNATYHYQEAAMGWLDNSNFSKGLHISRGWNKQHLVTYAESHDEERVTYKTTQYGNGSGDYQTKNIVTACGRDELIGVFLLGQPGPKMIWQFGELGFDYSINYCVDGTISEDDRCRLDAKPIVWNYLQKTYRKRIYDVYSAMNWLRNNYPQVMNAGNQYISYDFDGAFKRITITHPDMNVNIIGNFDVVPVSEVPQFPYMGTWYDYFEGVSIEENNPNNAFLLEPGEYRVYTSKELQKPSVTPLGADTTDGVTSIDQIQILDVDLELFPNPVKDILNVRYNLKESGVVDIKIIDMAGNVHQSVLQNEQHFIGLQNSKVNASELPIGEYLVLLSVNGKFAVKPFVKLH